MSSCKCNEKIIIMSQIYDEQGLLNIDQDIYDNLVKFEDIPKDETDLIKGRLKVTVEFLPEK